MTAARTRRALRAFVCAVLLLCAHATGRAQLEAEPPLAVVFEPSAAALQQADIRAAIAAELRVQVLDTPGYRVNTLTIGVAADGRIQLRYRPGVRLIERSLPAQRDPLATTLDIALLAQNLVRDQAAAVLAEPAQGPLPPVRQLAPEELVPVPPPPKRWPAEGLQLHAFLQVAAFNSVQVNPMLPRADADVAIGGGARLDIALARYLGAGVGFGYAHWEGAHATADTLQVSPTEFSDVQLWLRPRLPLDTLELYAALGAGLTLMADFEVTGEEALPDLGVNLAAQLGAIWWFYTRTGLLVELGLAYRHVGAGYPPDDLTLDLLQPTGTLGVAFAF